MTVPVLDLVLTAPREERVLGMSENTWFMQGVFAKMSTAHMVQRNLQHCWGRQEEAIIYIPEIRDRRKLTPVFKYIIIKPFG